MLTAATMVHGDTPLWGSPHPGLLGALLPGCDLDSLVSALGGKGPVPVSALGFWSISGSTPPAQEGCWAAVHGQAAAVTPPRKQNSLECLRKEQVPGIVSAHELGLLWLWCSLLPQPTARSGREQPV